MIERCSNDRLGINRIHVIVWSRFAPPVLLLSKRRKSHQDLIRPFITWVRCRNKACRESLQKLHFGRCSALSKTSFRDKDPHFLSPNPHFVTWETNISIECNQDQSKCTSHTPPQSFLSRVVPLSGMIALRKLSCPSQIRRFPSLAIYVLATQNALKPKFISCLHLRDRK